MDWQAWKDVQVEYQKAYLYRRPLVKFVQDLGHWGVEWGRKPAGSVLDLGCGIGYHRSFLCDGKMRYFGMDLAFKPLLEAKQFRKMGTVCGDAVYLPFRSGSFDRVISVYNLEHIQELDSAAKEVARVMKSDAVLDIALPTEGGFAWWLGRRLTTARYIRRRYGWDHEKVMAMEHVNSCADVLACLRHHFECRTIFLPFLLPSIHVNAVVVARCSKR